MHRRHPHHDDILACPRCDSRLVQPVAALRRSDGGLEVARRCPECEWRGSARCSAEAYAELEAAHRAARAALVALLERVEHARLRDEADRFAQALRRDAIGPDHF